MTGKTRKRIILTASGTLVIAALVYSFLPAPLEVQTAAIRYAPLRVTIEEEGETQVKQLYVIYSPVAGFARRFDLEAGDAVREGQPLIELEAPRAAILDARARAEAAARIEAAEATLLRMQEQAQAAEAVSEFAIRERRRVERLVESGFGTRQTLEQATSEAAQASANLQAARAAVTAARADLATARASLQSGPPAGTSQPVSEVLRAPESGRVLAVHRKSEGHVNPGERLIEIGNTDRLEVRVDVLSQDAVRIRPGTRVLLEQWGGDPPLEAVVSRVEPRGITVVSALGVEEQRVQIFADFVSQPGMWASLGTGYRVLAQFVIWENNNVLQVPTGALFRTQDGWAVFAVENKAAVRKPVTVGQRAALAAQVLAGLAEGDIVIVHPDASIKEGARVTPRS